MIDTNMCLPTRTYFSAGNIFSATIGEVMAPWSVYFYHKDFNVGYTGILGIIYIYPLF